MNKLWVALAAAGCLADVAAEPLTAALPPPWPEADTARLLAALERQALLAEAPGVAPALRLVVLAPPPWPAPQRQRYVSAAEFEQTMGRASGVLRVGLLREAGGRPGMQSMSMLLNTRPATRFTSLSLGYALSPTSALVAMASLGRSDGLGGPDSLLAQVSAVRTLAYSAGYVRRQVFRDDDRLAALWSVPDKARGAAALASPGRVAAGAARLAARPTATEHDLEFSYSRGAGRQGRLTAALMWRLNPGHEAGAGPDLLLGVRYAYGF